jgi:hypothetical protein
MNSITLAKTRALLRNVLTKNYAVPDTPFMPERNVTALAEAMRGAACYLEYGAGGSTVLASKIGSRTLSPSRVTVPGATAFRTNSPGSAISA